MNLLIIRKCFLLLHTMFGIAVKRKRTINIAWLDLANICASFQIESIFEWLVNSMKAILQVLVESY